MSPTKSRPSSKALGRRAKISKRPSPHSQWEFRPKLENEAAVLHSILGIYEIDVYRQIVNDIRVLITRLVQNHGFRDGSDRYKIIKDYTLALIEGRNPDNPEWLATSKKFKIPSQLGETFCQLLADYLSCTDVSLRPKYYQVTNTILNIVRMVDGLVSPELSSITDKAMPINQDLLESFRKYVSKRLSNVKPMRENPNLFDYRFNLLKNGPNGVPKIETAIPEAVALLNSKLARPFRIVCEELNCSYLYDYLVQLVDSTERLPNLSAKPTSGPGNYSDTSVNKSDTVRLRVLASIPDSGFKTRTVAIVDFWSQLVLEPFRSHVQDVIEMKFGNTDFRKDQDLGVAKMKEFTQRCLESEVVQGKDKLLTLDTKYLKCYDISSWTDRFHRDLQKIVVKELFGSRFAEAWAQLVVHCPWYHIKSRSTIKYGQGQGMGTNGSFDIATLTDHLLINYSIDRSQVTSRVFPHNACYGKVGDDLWIYDPEDRIPEIYEEINLPINYSKSKGYSKGNSYVEFCSRTFLDNFDVSRISPKIISKSKDFRYIPALLGLCSSRGIQLDASSFESLNRKVKGKEETYLDKLQDWIVSYLMIRETERGSAFQSLDQDYLVKGNWVTGELVPKLFADPKLMCRLLIAYSIVTMIENYESIEDRLFDLVDAMDDICDEITLLTEKDTNLFDISDPKVAIIRGAFKTEILTPKQIVILGRYVDQRRLLQEDLIEANDEVMFADGWEAIYEYSRKLSKIANRSCYDQGNINYEVERVISRQFKMVKILERLDDDYTTLSGLSPQQLRKIWQNIPYDEIATKWEGYLITL